MNIIILQVLALLISPQLIKFQLIKYESDNGFFLNKNNNFIGISFSDMTSFNYYKDKYDIKSI